MDVYGYKADGFRAYVKDCKERGFTVDERLEMLDGLYRYFRTYKSKKHSLRWNIERFLLDNGMKKSEKRAIKKNLVRS